LELSFAISHWSGRFSFFHFRDQRSEKKEQRTTHSVRLPRLGTQNERRSEASVLAQFDPNEILRCHDQGQGRRTFSGLPNRQTCHLAGPPVYERLLPLASCRVPAWCPDFECSACLQPAKSRKCHGVTSRTGRASVSESHHRLSLPLPTVAGGRWSRQNGRVDRRDVQRS